MNTRLLLISDSSAVVETLLASLQRQFRVQTGARPQQAEDLLRTLPDLVLFNAALLQGSETLWKGFAASCEASGVRTVLFSAQEQSEGPLSALCPWCEHVLPGVSSPLLVCEYLHSLHQLDILASEVELVQGRLYEKKMELEEGLRSAAHIQRSLMPKQFPQIGQLRFASCFIPCQTVGGDLFNLFRLDEDTLALYMLDVSGHGVPAAMVTVSVYQALSLHTSQIVKVSRAEAPYYRIASPEDVLSQLDQEYPFERFESFFTICYLLVEPRSGRIRFANAAHPPTLICRADGSLELLDADGTLIGLGGLVPYECGEAQLQPGDRLFLYTDGLFEHENFDGQQFGHQRLQDLILRSRQQPLEEQCQALIDELRVFGEERPFADDVTLLAVEYVAPGEHTGS